MLRPRFPLAFARVAGTAVTLALLSVASAQRDPRSAETPSAEFHFARMIYRDYQGRGNLGWWAQDWPDAEEHFNQGVGRLTRVELGPPVAIDLLDERLFDYPWLYATQVGYWVLSDEELAQLREYLRRGGFLMADDFFDESEWGPFQETMARLFPDRPIREIDDADEILHVLYDIDKFTQIPGLRHLGGYGGGFRGSFRGGGLGRSLGVGYVQGLPEPHWRGIYDDDDRLMIAINYNQDVGDAWEHADDTYYPQPMTALAYRFGVNYIVYAMTH